MRKGMSHIFSPRFLIFMCSNDQAALYSAPRHVSFLPVMDKPWVTRTLLLLTVFGLKVVK